VGRALRTHGGDRKSEAVKNTDDNQVDNINLNKGGASSDYTLARLDRDRPELAERVRAGELSANAAAIEAGFCGSVGDDQATRTLETRQTDQKHSIRSIAGNPGRGLLGRIRG
jgi:hypothetical protein